MMSEQEFEYHMDHLKLCDVDYVADVLEITTEELISAFYRRAERFLETEHGD